jgi:GMP synthase (glutamine-hydrolysing)
MGTKIAVIDASRGETPAGQNRVREINAATTVYKVSDREYPPTPTGRVLPYDGVVISGSQTAAYDNLDWIHELTSWARSTHRANVPMLGICWGHQFLAQTFGGRVVDMGDHEIGYRTVKRCGEDPLFAGVPDSFTAFETHSDRVAELPSGAVELARNEYGIQAFRLGSSYGVQFHPEYDRETAEWVVGNKELSPERLEDVEATITEQNVSAAEITKAVFDNFLTIVAAHRRSPTASWS